MALALSQVTPAVALREGRASAVARHPTHFDPNFQSAGISALILAFFFERMNSKVPSQRWEHDAAARGIDA